jgi:SAM-dependent methyltransferase
MTTTTGTPAGTSDRPARSGTTQETYWSRRSEDWAQLQEPNLTPAYDSCLDIAGVGSGTRLLDVGCGSGLALRRAADRGADVSGLDATQALLDIARRRVPGARLEHGDIEELPFDDDAFDVVTGFNSFQYAADPAVALAEAARVTRPGGRVLALVWGPSEVSEATDHLVAVRALMPPAPKAAPGPTAVSPDEGIADLLAGAGLADVSVGYVDGPLAYPDEATALRALTASGPVVQVIEHAGEDAVRAAILGGIAAYRRADGSYYLRTSWRYAVGTVGA